MENTLYLECYSGISGDMTVAALLDLGARPTALERALNSLPISGFHTKISRVKKSGLDACDFEVILQHENHDHDMQYLHEAESQITSHHAHEQESEHPHSYVHHSHKNLTDILSMIQLADMTESAKQTASDIFHILGEAEAKAHGTSIEEVHFHEVGAVDSIVDIISTAVCLDSLAVTRVIIPVLYEGCGTIRCQHGILPVPVPAVVNIAQANSLPLHITDTAGEFVTPTGAAIAAAVRTDSILPKHFRILKTGLGAGKRNYERPSILRAMLIEPAPENLEQIEGSAETSNADSIYKLETNIDDCSGEAMGYVFECLMNAGAKDVHYFPVFMKKNRPAYQLNVLCREEDVTKLEQIIFSQTTTIGIRRQCMERSILPREIKILPTSYGEIRVKICRMNHQIRIYPEYESVIELCTKENLSYFEMYCKIQEICRKQLEDF